MRRIFFLVGMLAIAFLQSARATSQLIVNGSFVGTSYAPWQVAGTPGTQFYPGYVSLGNANGAVQSLYQTITFRTNMIAATLTLENSTTSTDPNGDDTLIVYITDTDFRILQQIGSGLSSSGADGSVNTASATFINYAGSNILATLAGQTVNLVFNVKTDATYGIDTSFNIIDVSLVVGTTADIPVNDNFTNAAALSTEGTTNLITTTYASREAGEPVIAGARGGHSLWYSWTPTAIGKAYIAVTDTSFTSLVAVYTGTTISNLTKVASFDGINNSDGSSGVTFNASANTEYFITVDGYEGASGTGELIVRFVQDTTAPTVAITSPAAGADVSGSSIAIKGTSHDNVKVASVYYQLENADTNTPWALATTLNSWTNWTASVSNLIAGPNTVRAQAYDTSGNMSVISSHKVNYIIKTPILISTNGAGKITGATNTELLNVGYPYTLTAKASSGYVFSNWTTSDGTEITNSPILKFTMASNLVYVANFVVNPYIVPGGTYNGLFFDAANVTPTNSGYFSAQVATNGHFTARFIQGAKTYAVAGVFSLTGGWSTNTPKIWGGTPLSMQLDLAGGSDITGYVGDSVLTSYREVYSRKNVAPETGKYTIVFPPDFSGTPGGYGYGSLTVSSAGAVTLSATLGDGTKITPTAFLSEDGAWPLYVSLDSGKGMLLGWLEFTNAYDRDIDGVINWMRPAQASVLAYKSGVTNKVEIAGSAFHYTNGVPLLDLAGGGQIFLSGGGLTESITDDFTLAANNKVTGTDKLHLTLSTGTGIFTGTTTNALGKTVTFNGALLQKQNAGFGEFINSQQTGSVVISPQ